MAHRSVLAAIRASNSLLQRVCVKLAWLVVRLFSVPGREVCERPILKTRIVIRARFSVESRGARLGTTCPASRCADQGVGRTAATGIIGAATGADTIAGGSAEAGGAW